MSLIAHESGVADVSVADVSVADVSVADVFSAHRCGYCP